MATGTWTLNCDMLYLSAENLSSESIGTIVSSSAFLTKLFGSIVKIVFSFNLIHHHCWDYCCSDLKRNEAMRE
jgi:hypothetical protein